MKQFRSGLLISALLACAACSNVRQAPVEDRQEAGAVPELPAAPAADPAAGPPPGKPLREEADALWEELPGSVEPDASPAPAQTDRHSDNPAVIALLQDTELSISQGDPEAAAGSVERALRLEPKNPWLWHRLAALKLAQGDRRLAIALAQKSNSLSAGSPDVRKANADLISKARGTGSE